MHIKKCSEAGILRGDLDPVMFHPFRAKVAIGEVSRRPDSRQLYWVYPVLGKVMALARAMGYLVRETFFPRGLMLMDHPARGQPPYVLSLSHGGSRKRCL